MFETGAVIDDESSGGLTVRGHISGKGGTYAVTLLVKMLAVVDKPMSEIYEEITRRFAPRYIVKADFMSDPEHRQKISRVLMKDRLLPGFSENVREVPCRNSCKIYFGDGWIITRFSGIEPLLHTFCEMPVWERAERVCEELRKFLGL